MRSSYHHPRTEIRRSPTEGVGLFATGPIDAGEVILATGGQVLPFSALPSLELPAHPIQIETDLVLAPLDPRQLDGIFVVNHSCDPNAGFRDQVTLVARRPIRAGEEIAYDYVMTDSDPSGQETFAMECLCGQPACRRRITDLDWRQPLLQARYHGYFAAYLARRIAARK